MELEVSIVLLAIAVSVDGFGVGLACGIRNLVILPLSLIMICIVSAGSVAVSMFLGHSLALIIPVELVSQSGGFVLLIMGFYFIIQGIGIKDKKKKQSSFKGKNFREKISLITEVPEEADVDKSGTLNTKESLILGVALGADAFGAGFGAVLLGLNPFVTVAAVGITKLIMIPAGIFLGQRAISVDLFSRYAPVISGLILLIIAMSVFI